MRHQRSATQLLPFGPSPVAHKPTYHHAASFSHLVSPTSPVTSVYSILQTPVASRPRSRSRQSPARSEMSAFSSIAPSEQSPESASLFSLSSSELASISSSSTDPNFPATPPSSLPPSPSPLHMSFSSGKVRPLPTPPVAVRPRGATVPSLQRPPRLSIVISQSSAATRASTAAASTSESRDDDTTPLARRPSPAPTSAFSLSAFPIPPPLAPAPPYSRPPTPPPKSPRTYAARVPAPPRALAPLRTSAPPRTSVSLSFARARARRGRVLPPQRAPPRSQQLPRAPVPEEEEEAARRSISHFATPPRRIVAPPSTPPANMSTFGLTPSFTTPPRVRPLPRPPTVLAA